jgi:soluble lytic murein transglycosylase
LRLAAALQQVGAGDLAAAAVVKAWRELSLTQAEEGAFLSQYSKTLAPHHSARQDALLWRDRATEAERMQALVDSGTAKLAAARIALIRKDDGVDALIAAVPSALSDDPGLAYARFQWRDSKGRINDATALMQERSASKESLGQPEAWSNRRRDLARQLMRDGKAKEAYQLASRHYLTEGDDYSDLEWLSGFIALTDLKDPETALKHFRHLRIAVATPISLGRAGYWEGRAYEATGRTEDAHAAYAFGGEFQSSYYGLLAAEKAGLPMDADLLGKEAYADWRNASFVKSSVFQAAMLLRAADQPLLFTRFLRHLAESLTPSEQGQLAEMALQLDQPYAAVYLAKYAADGGVVHMRPYFPLPEIAKNKFSVPTELALSIARRESEFYSQATSPAGARGLMQVMPGTAKIMAAKLGMTYEAGRLTSDPGYNTTIGSAYLAELISEFGPAYALVAAGYNAGPGRPRSWIQTYGDPRDPAVDAVDWVEHIPFNETRNYVMRVMESVVIYRARLTGQTGPIRLSEELKGR